MPDTAARKNLLGEFKRVLRPGTPTKYATELNGLTMNGNPVRILQLWARST
ncbi:MAG TPA: hypothetical protein VEW08_14020 [Steroidobacteraceae bacterium]|nr:hypothetical protein [Steroidobacteraceae bacterium]